MEVAQTSFLVDRLGQDCEPGQFLRELTQNSIEAIVRTGEAGRILWHATPAASDTSGRKLTITDTGDGMTGEMMERHINQLSASGSQQDISGNFGVGAKISTAPRNPAGVLYRSWNGGLGHEVLLCRDPFTGHYGLRQYPMSNGQFTYHPAVPDNCKPGMIEEHGTQVILHGKSEKEDTTRPPEGMSSSSSVWITKYLNSRYFRFPESVTVCVDEGSLDTIAANGSVRTLTGQRCYLDEHAVASGEVKLTGARAHWWILEEDKSLTADAAYIESAGHMSALFKDELYELRNGRAGTSRLQQFGITFGFRRVVIYIEPRSAKNHWITSNTTRSHLLLNHRPLPWDGWAVEFRKKMPVALRRFIKEQGAKAANTDHSKTVRRRLDKIMDLFKPQQRYRLTATGQAKAGGQAGNGTASKAKAGKPASKSKGKRVQKRKGSRRDSNSDNQGSPAEKTNRDLYPKTVWVSVKDGTRSPGFLDNRAAAYLSEQNLLQINADCCVYADMIDHCSKQVAGRLGGAVLAANVVRGWYEQALMETVIGMNALRNRKEWSDCDINKALSPESLTAAVMQRYHIACCTHEELQRKLRALPTQAAASPSTRSRLRRRNGGETVHPAGQQAEATVLPPSNAATLSVSG